MEPIIEFESQVQLNECLQWWKERLFLSDWIITAHTVSECPEGAGLNTSDYLHNCSVIKIVKAEKYGVERLMRYCAEKILVHELLHCKYCWLEYSSTSYCAAYTEAKEHMLLEQMARTLITVKYDLPPGWFENTEITVGEGFV